MPPSASARSSSIWARENGLPSAALYLVLYSGYCTEKFLLNYQRLTIPDADTCVGACTSQGNKH
jgi:hypothetical protein